MLYIRQELSYDTFYPRADKVFRLGYRITRPTRTDISAATPTPLAPALEEEYPEIEHITRIYFDSQVLFEYRFMRRMSYTQILIFSMCFPSKCLQEILPGF